MKKSTVVSIVLAIVSMALVYFLYNSIMTENNKKSEIARVEELVKKKLVTIRKAQSGFYSVHGRYTQSWDTLRSFIQNGKFPIIDRKERVMVINGRDSIQVKIDTLARVSVLDSLFSPEKEPNFDLATIDKIPNSTKSFSISVSKGENGICYIEVVDVDPIDPDRKEGGKKSPLKFGSLSEVTTKANWEK